MKSYILAFDVGTSGVKAVLVDFDASLAGTVTQNITLITPQPEWNEQDPKELWDKVCLSARQVISNCQVKPEQIKAVVFGTYWKGIIPLDKNGEPLHNNIIWLDGRAEEQAVRMNAALNMPIMNRKEYWPKLLWLKEKRSEVYEQAESILDANAYLVFKSTGEKVANYNANFIKTTHPRMKNFFNSFMDVAGLDMDKFPPMVPSTQKVGVVTPDAAELLGVCAKTPVFGGTTDLASIPIGCGCTQPGQWHMYLGSSGWNGTVVPENSIDPSIPTLPFYPGYELALAGIQSVGMSLDWAIQLMYQSERNNATGEIFELINKEAGKVGPGSDELLSVSWIHGERPPFPVNQHGLYFNATALHSRGHFMRATMEGISYHMRAEMETITGSGCLSRPSSIRTAGGCACSPIWMQAMADILNIPIEVPQNTRHVGAIGVAYCGMVGLGLYKDFSGAREMVRIEHTFEPRTNFRVRYDNAYKVWKKLPDELQKTYDMVENLNKQQGET